MFKYLKLDKNSPLPKHHQLKQKLIALIKSKRLVQGERLPSDNELMSALNLSRATVRHAIGELVKEGVLYREQGRGTFIADAAQRSEGSKNFSFIVYDFQWLMHPFISEAIQGAKTIADKSGYNLTVATFVSENGDKSHFYKQLERQDIGGLLILCEVMTDEDLARLVEIKMPFVWLGGHVTNLDVHAVSVDFQEGFFNAASHLLGLGHRHIGVLTGWNDNHRGDADKLSGYQVALEKYGIPFESDMVRECHYDEVLAYKATLELLERENRPTAIIAFDDIMAMGVIRAANDRGLSVPTDLAVIGCNDMKLSSLVKPALTTLNVSAHTIGETACRMLVRLKNGDILKQKVVTPPCQFIHRKSCCSNNTDICNGENQS